MFPMGVRYALGGLFAFALINGAISACTLSAPDPGLSGHSGMGGESAASGGTSSGSGARAGGGTAVVPDAGGPGASGSLPTGAACKADKDCEADHCIDGVCCESACEGCNACSNALTGLADGKCAPVGNGQDPHDACKDETAKSQCGNDGECDGNGECRKVSPSHVCAAGACSADGKSFIPTTTCSALGDAVCTTAAPQDCEGYPCEATGCAKPCSKQSDCTNPGTYCDTTSAKCAAQKSDGSPASTKLECTSGIVADGVCCNEECSGCKACTSALNGQAAGTTGQCLPAKANMPAPHSACSANLPCGMDGACDGNGGCHYPTVGTSCDTSSCSGSTLTPKACDSSHTCSPFPGNTCPNSLVCASASACKTKCAADSDCIDGYYCASGGTCTAKQAGGTCTTAKECGSGFCVDGYCCNAKCDGLCQSCKATPGSCTSVTTPRSSCGGSGTCGTKKCDGVSPSCVFPQADVSCPDTCSTDWSGVMSSACNGAGACGTGSKNSCNSDQYCNTNTSGCASKLASGASSTCTKDIQCQSGTCCGGHCATTSNDKSNCGVCGKTCASNQVCSAGSCVCGSGTCGGSDLCGTWTFDTCTLDRASWFLDENRDQNAASGFAVISKRARSGSCSLKWDMSSAGAWANINLHMCGSTSNTTSVKGVQIWMYLEGTALSGVISKGSVSLMNGTTTVGSFYLSDCPLNTGQYQLINGTFSTSGPATDINIDFLAPGYMWDGTVYIDDVTIF